MEKAKVEYHKKTDIVHMLNYEIYNHITKSETSQENH